MSPRLDCAGGVALLGGEAKPLHRLDEVLGNALAIAVHGCETVLSGSIILLGGPSVPLRRLCVVLRNARAIGVQEAEIQLSRSITLSFL